MPKTSAQISIIEAICDKRIISDSLSPAQASLLKLIDNLPLSSEEAEIAIEATGRKELPQQVFRIVLAICGRRSGKSVKICANLVVFQACIARHPIPAGERGTVLLVAPTEKQARHTFRIIEEKIRRSPTLNRLIVVARSSSGESTLELSNGVDITVAAANSKHVRGANIIAAVFEEGAFFQNSDTGTYNLEEIVNAVRPGMLTVPDSKLIIVSSPWIQSGYSWELYRDRDKHPDVLVWRAPSWVMNPTLDQGELDRERQRNEAYWRREYAAEWVVTASSPLLPADAVEAAVGLPGVAEFPWKSGYAFCVGLDPSSRGDDFGLAVAHAENNKIIVDYVKAWRAPGRGRYIDYNVVLPHIIATMTRYRAPKCWSDQVASAAISAALTKEGFQFEQTTTFGTKAREKFHLLRQKLVSGDLILPDDPELIHQLKALEEILADAGRSTVEARTGKDDKAVVTALAVWAAATQTPIKPWVDFVFLDDLLDARDWKPISTM